MKKFLTYLFVSLSLLGCKDKTEVNRPETNEIIVTVKSDSIHVHPKWKYVSDKPVIYFHTQNLAYWLDTKKIQILAVEKSKEYETGTFEVNGSEWTYHINNQDADIDRGRVCFAEVAFFTCNDGSIVQRTYMSDVVQAPNKPLQ
jgi:hypothetical protein